MPRVETFHLSKQKITNNRPHQSDINDNSIVNSRTMCRSDFMPSNKFGGMSRSPDPRFNLENIPSSTSAINPATQSNSNISSLKNGNYLGFKPEYDISKKLQDFVVNITPRQLSKPILSVTPTAG